MSVSAMAVSRSFSRRVSGIRDSLPDAMLQDKAFIVKKLDALQQRVKKRGMPQHEISRRLTSLEKRIQSSVRRRERRQAMVPAVTVPENLPIFQKRKEIVSAIRNRQVVIISGDTGSGKSTQIPKMCLEAGRGISGKIGCTQPRRIAATTVAGRIAEELGEELGQSVGYKIRFKDKTRPAGYIKILTDGMLLAETQGAPFLREYDTLIVDEAHERSLNIDFVLGILKTLLPQRDDLKLIITSATIDTEKFAKAFDGAEVIDVKGRMYPVRVEYLPVDPKQEDAGDVTYVDMAVDAVEDIRKKAGRGDILIFMPTERDIIETCDRLGARQFPKTMVMPLFARLPRAQQKRVFAPFAGQKIVVATNVAETSLTIPGIKYVIDTGLARILRYLPRTRTTSLPIGPISRSSADQRKGRCGRVENGICIRLYSEEDYASRPEFTAPEILRSNLAEVVLRMLSLNLGDISSFPFVDKPNRRNINDGFNLLVELGAVVKDREGFSLTEKGRVMARMPMDPRISKMILEAAKEGCIKEVSVIASALSIQDPRERPAEKASQADEIHAPFKDTDSDFITLLNIWNRYHRSLASLKTQNKMRRFCKTHFLSFPRMREWKDIHEQISSVLRERGIKDDPKAVPTTPESLYAAIHRSILSGFLANIAVKKDQNIYQATKGKEVMIFPGSALFGKGRKWIVAAEMVKTSRLFARTVARIESRWLEALGGNLCTSTYFEPHWDKERGQVRAYQQVTLFGLVIVPRRSVPYGSSAPEESHRIFVRCALVDGEVREKPAFLKHNLNLVKKIMDLEAKVRRRGILVNEESLITFYSDRLPGVFNMGQLNKKIKERGGDEFLRMTQQDLTLFFPDEEELALFPDHVAMAGRQFECAYRFEPGAREDGVTVTIPSTFVSRIPSPCLEWAVPGLLKEKIGAVIKSLPKRYRKQFVPVSKSVETIVREMERTDEPFITALARFIYQKFGVNIPAADWNTVNIPEHLKTRVSVTDQQGRELHSGRDFERIRKEMRSVPSWEAKIDIPEDVKGKWEKSGLISWNFGTLPESIAFGENSAAYPALVPADGSVQIRLFKDSHKALNAHKKGVKSLFCLHLTKELKFLKRTLRLSGETEKAAQYFGGAGEVEKALYETLLDRLFCRNVRKEEEFFNYARMIRPALNTEGKELLSLSEKVIQAFYRLRSVLHAIETANRSSRAVLDLCVEIRRETTRLVPVAFIRHYQADRLLHLPRYMKGMEMRAQRGANDLEKDRGKARQAAKFVDAWEKMQAGLSPYASQEKKEAVDAFRWMVEEFKVSLFAPELKTPFPVSGKRLEKKQQEIERML